MIRGELKKILSTRTLLGFAIGSLAFAALNVVIVAVASGDLTAASQKREALAGMPVLFALLGVVGAAGEFRHRTAAPSVLAAGGESGRLLLARSGVYVGAAFSVAALTTALSVAVGLPLLAGQPGPELGLGDVVAVAIANLAAAMLCVTIGVAVGALVRNQVGGVVALLMLNFALNPLLAMTYEAAGNLTPFGAAQVLSGMTHDTTVSVAGAGLILAAWTLPLLALAIAGERRRDLA